MLLASGYSKLTCLKSSQDSAVSISHFTRGSAITGVLAGSDNPNSGSQIYSTSTLPLRNLLRPSKPCLWLQPRPRTPKPLCAHWLAILLFTFNFTFHYKRIERHYCERIESYRTGNKNENPASLLFHTAPSLDTCGCHQTS